MNFLLLVACFVAAAAAVPHDEWVQFKRKYNKYHGDEDEMRRGIFYSNLKKIDEHNAKFASGQVSFKLKMNRFGDTLRHKVCSFLNDDDTDKCDVYKLMNNIKLSVDWREKGAVTPVREQGEDCCSGWAFSAAGAIEGLNAIKNNDTQPLSVQSLVDCSAGGKDKDGCSGGSLNNAFAFARDAGIYYDKDYIYAGKAGKCPNNPPGKTFKVEGCVNITTEDQLIDAISNMGPVSVAIDASAFAFQFYSEGVYYDEYWNVTRLDHAMLAVGYGSENGKDYYLVKNSYGTEWGEEGYIKIIRNDKNNCGIASRASVPTPVITKV